VAVSARDELDVGLTTVALRGLRASPAGARGRADIVAHRLSEAIRLGLILDGERLPSETRLAEQLGVATVTLREALETLRGQGLIRTRRGRGGGTIVTAPADRAEGLVERLSALTAQDLRDLGDLRSAVLGMAAALAARRAMPQEVSRLWQHVERLRAAGTTTGERRRADTQLTMGVAAAAQSPRLAKEALRMRSEVGDLLWLEDDTIDINDSLVARTHLVEAIERSDAEGARRAAETLVAADTGRLVRLHLRACRERDRSCGRRRGGRDRGVMTTVVDAAGVLDDLDAELGRVFGALRALAAEHVELVTSARQAGGVVRIKDLGVLRPTIFAVLDSHPDTIVGAGVITAADLLEDTTRWLEWWWPRTGMPPEQLRVNLDPAAPDFYDYTNEDWYTHPDRTRDIGIAGPFVDHVCTGEYSATLTVPAVDGDELLGVAAADILVSSIERRLLPGMLRADRPLVVATGAGRVVASTDPVWSPGLLLPQAALPTPDVDRDPALPWTTGVSPLRSWVVLEPPPQL
jgi:DNA-binding FadR family transcriptional regulator